MSKNFTKKFNEVEKKYVSQIFLYKDIYSVHSTRYNYIL
jgi:hypothetical protein